MNFMRKIVWKAKLTHHNKRPPTFPPCAYSHLCAMSISKQLRVTYSGRSKEKENNKIN